eukprot:scaffold60130_cov62-Phaeocystis_antarctica.AAC.2
MTHLVHVHGHVHVYARMHCPCTTHARAPRFVCHVSDDVPLEVLREHGWGWVIGRVAYGRLDTAPPRVGSERAVVAREARPAETEARLEAGSAWPTRRSAPTACSMASLSAPGVRSAMSPAWDICVYVCMSPACACACACARVHCIHVRFCVRVRACVRGAAPRAHGTCTLAVCMHMHMHMHIT